MSDACSALGAGPSRGAVSGRRQSGLWPRRLAGGRAQERPGGGSPGSRFRRAEGEEGRRCLNTNSPFFSNALFPPQVMEWGEFIARGRPGS